MDVLKIDLDHAQPRLKRDALSALVTSRYNDDKITDRPVDGWSAYWRSQTSSEDDTWIDPITGTLMLMPLPLTKAWATNGTGAFLRFTKANYTLVTGAGWVNHNANGQSSNYLHKLDAGADEVVKTTAAGYHNGEFLENRPHYISYHITATDSEDRIVMDCGWDYDNRNTVHTGDRSTYPVYFRFWSSGKVEVYLNGTLNATDSISPVSKFAGDVKQNQHVQVLLIPMRDSGVLVYSTSGGGFFWERLDIEPDEANPVIVPAYEFWWYGYGVTSVECQPLGFRSSGYRASLAIHWSQAPQVGDVADDVYVFHDTGFAVSGTNTAVGSVVEQLDALTAFVPDGLTKSCRAKITLTGDGYGTPFVYGAQIGFPGEYGTTDNSEEREVQDWTVSAHLDVPESKQDLKFTFTLKDLATLQPEGQFFLETMSYRPIRARIGDMSLIDGIAGAPALMWGSHRGVDEITFEVGGLFKQLELYRFTDAVALDRLSVKQCLDFLAQRAGIPVDRCDIEEFGIDVGEFSRPSKGEFHTRIEVGDTAAEWWNRIFDEYLPDCHWCERPTVGLVTKLVAFSPENAPTLAEPYRIFDTTDAARAELEGLGNTGEDLDLLTASRTYRSLDQTILPPEANEAWVQGWDRRTNRPIVVYQRDSAAQDPELSPGNRPENWGPLNRYGYINHAFATEAQCTDAVGRLAKRLFYPRKIREIEIDMMIDPDSLVPLWIGDEVELVEDRAEEQVVSRYRIIRFGVDFLREYDAGEDETGSLIARPGRYVLEFIDTVNTTSLGLGHALPGSSLREMESFHFLRMKKNFQMKSTAVRSPRLVATEVTS